MACIRDPIGVRIHLGSRVHPMQRSTRLCASPRRPLRRYGRGLRDRVGAPGWVAFTEGETQPR
jgi:hypothetical protein